MELKDRIDLLLDVIKRFDFYINSTNTKASLVIAWNGIVIGAVLLKYDAILQLFDKPASVSFASFLLFVIGGLAVVSNFVVFWVVFPFLAPTSKSRAEQKTLSTNSRFFFGTVANLDQDTYFDMMSKDSDEEILRDLSDQVVVVGKGLASKMSLLQKSIWGIGVQLLMVLALLSLKFLS